MAKNLLFVLLLIGFSTWSKAQLQEGKSPRRELMIISDNDNYTFNYSDRYYTNGLAFGYSYPGKKGRKSIEGDSSKVVRSIILGQQIYTPSDISSVSANLYDRPYAGWLFVRYSSTRFLPGDAAISFSTEFGLTGEYSLAESTQKWWHGVVKYKQPRGWNSQIASGFGLNFSTSASKSWRVAKVCDITSTTRIRFGSHFQDGSQEVALRVGAIGTFDYSASNNSRIGFTQEQVLQKASEHFLLAGVRFTSVLQNALIEGSSWPKESPHQESVHPQFTTFRLGWVSSIKAFTIKIIWYHITPEVIGGDNHQFARLLLSYRFE